MIACDENAVHVLLSIDDLVNDYARMSRGGASSHPYEKVLLESLLQVILVGRVIGPWLEPSLVCPL